MDIELMEKVVEKVEKSIKNLKEQIIESSRVIHEEPVISINEVYHLLSELILSHQTNLLGISMLLKQEVARERMSRASSN